MSPNPKIKERIAKSRLAQELGMYVPRLDYYPTSEQFWTLINEGWRLYLDESGKIVAYSPPNINLAERMTQFDGTSAQ